MRKNERVYVAGHTGLVGSSICRTLSARGFLNLVVRAHSELDLTDQAAVRRFFATEKIDSVVLAAGTVGGIHANNSRPANFIYENLMIECCVIHEAFRAGIGRMLFLGSSCIYPRECPQPIREEYLLTGPLEPTNAAYAVAKIAGIELCASYNRQHGTDYRAVMPTNLYGPNDNYDLVGGHVLPALIRKFHLAKLAARRDWKSVEKNERAFGPIPADIRTTLNGPEPPCVLLWGTGTPLREFLHVDDMAEACRHVMDLDADVYRRHTQPTCAFLNVGAGVDHSIREIAEIVQKIVGFEGKVTFDASRPDGTPRKLLDVSRMRELGWRATVPLEKGIEATYRAFLETESLF